MPISLNDRGTHLEVVSSGSGTAANVLVIKRSTTNTLEAGLGLHGDSQPSLLAGGTEVNYFEATVGSGNTSAWLLMNQGGTLALHLVSCGAHDSGGAGYRLLRVNQTP